MKKLFLLLISLFIFTNCSSDDNINNNNPYLPNYPVNITINLDLPQYVSLQYPSNTKYINTVGAGVRGIIVINTGAGFNAFDAACPNQPLSDCSTMRINGINAVCPCDDVSYSLYSGIGDAQYQMKRYRVDVMGNSLRIYN